MEYLKFLEISYTKGISILSDGSFKDNQKEKLKYIKNVIKQLAFKQ